MKTRRICLIVLALLITSTIFGQKREVHILAVNDMHAAIEEFPQLAAIADSLRTLYPSMLILSAGDNRTGNPKNDMFRVSSLPMVSLMNLVGFDATTLGNHEFDVGSLPPLMAYSGFSVPTKVYDFDGIKIGIIGLIQINSQGRPDTHPDNLKGIRFANPMKVIKQYRSFSHHCDATILLSHLGYEDDKEVANNNSWLDLIIGGHSHTQLTANEPLHNGVLITQNKNKLQKATHITLTFNNGKLRKKTAEYIDVRSFPKKNRMVEVMVEYFSNNPMFKRVVGRTESAFKTKEELNYLMCDAFLHEGQADLSIVNNGGVRLDSLAAGDITVQDVLSMDPFYNEAVELMLTGEEIMKILTTYSRGSLYHLPRVAGAICEVTVDKEDKHKDRLKSIRLKTLDGQDFDMQKTYKVVTNSYMQSACKSYISNPGHSLNIQTSVMLTNYLEKLGVISNKGMQNMKVTEE